MKRLPLADRVTRALLVMSLVVLVGRVLSVPGPFGANDVSRWATIRSLVDFSTFAVGQRIRAPDGRLVEDKPQGTIDLVLDPRTGFFYSSKPPLLSTIMAAEYWALHRALDWRIDTHEPQIMKVLLLTFNVTALTTYLLVFARFLEDLKIVGWSRAVLIGLAGLGTFVTTFATSITNHVPAAVSTLLSAYCFRNAWVGGARLAYFGAGLFAGVAASLEIPAVIFLGVVGIVLVVRSPLRTFGLYFPAALIPMGGFWLTNSLSFGDPFFFYRHPKDWFAYPGGYWDAPSGVDLFDKGPVEYSFHYLLGHHGIISLTPMFFLAIVGLVRTNQAIPRARSWMVAGLMCPALVGLLALGRVDVPVPTVVSMAPSLLVAGLCFVLPWRWFERAGADPAGFDRAFSRVTIACSLVVASFYVSGTSNYGGIAAGPRWFMWLMPLWIVFMGSGTAELLDSKRGRFVLSALLAFSAYSALSPGVSAWTNPWIYSFFFR
ncbi:MAG: hypothetical protein HY791_19735 [Deltaproteobacteria bacterium]|nr:hypothetical protein [Deltaproteobacteria bacterium]